MVKNQSNFESVTYTHAHTHTTYRDWRVDGLLSQNDKLDHHASDDNNNHNNHCYHDDDNLVKTLCGRDYGVF